MQAPTIVLHADVVAMACAMATCAACFVAQAAEQLPLASLASTAQAPASAPASARELTIAAVKAHAPADTPDSAKLPASTADAQDPIAAQSSHEAPQQVQLAVQLRGAQAVVHIGPQDKLAVLADMHSQRCGSSWSIDRSAVHVNGSRVLDAAGLELSISRITSVEQVKVRCALASLVLTYLHNLYST